MSRRFLTIQALAAAAIFALACSQANAPTAPTKKATPAQASAEPAPAVVAAALPTSGKVFVCPMTECNEVKALPGKCSKCGMDLVENDRANLSWVCPMKECNEVKAEPGKCSKCGMDLALKAKAAAPAKP